MNKTCIDCGELVKGKSLRCEECKRIRNNKLISIRKKRPDVAKTCIDCGELVKGKSLRCEECKRIHNNKQISIRNKRPDVAEKKYLYIKDYQTKNKEKRKVWSKNYYENNKDKCFKNTMKWRNNNKGKHYKKNYLSYKTNIDNKYSILPYHYQLFKNELHNEELLKTLQILKKINILLDTY